MKAKVIVGFSDDKGFTYIKGTVVNFDKAYVTKLVELGKVEVLGDQTKASKAKSRTDKASKNNARKTV